MNKNNSGAVREYEEFYSDECISILSKHLRREMNQRGANIWGLRQQWREYMSLRQESVEYLKSVNEWLHTEPTKERARTIDVDDI